jgi:hypothetical protein
MNPAIPWKDYTLKKPKTKNLNRYQQDLKQCVECHRLVGPIGRTQCSLCGSFICGRHFDLRSKSHLCSRCRANQQAFLNQPNSQQPNQQVVTAEHILNNIRYAQGLIDNNDKNAELTIKSIFDLIK